MSPDGLQASIEKMRAAGVGDAAIDTFAHYYEQLREGASGMLPESEIEPVEDLPTLDELPEGDPAIVDTAVVLKLNGGLGTSMGMTKAKSLLEAKEGQTFLDIIVGQVLGLRERFGARVPLVLMNSFATRDDSLAALRRHPEIESDVPLDFLQNKEPKLPPTTCSRSPGRPTRRSSGPARPRRPLHGAGHLRDARRRCSSTATATPSSPTPTTSARCSTRGSSPGSRARSCPFAMEVAERTEADRKGGHLARLHGGRPRAARDRADARRGPRLAAGRRPPPLLQHEQPVGRPARRCATRSRRATACSACR